MGRCMGLKWLKYYAKIAEETAKLSTAEKLKVGCVIVKDNRILSIGYNGTPAGWDNQCEYLTLDGEWKTKAEVIHAERNCLDKIAKSTDSSEGSVMFVTHTPCIECAKSIYSCGIKAVFFINDYSASNGSGINFLKEVGIETCQIGLL